jgi:SAM-dependent methyltransferase
LRQRGLLVYNDTQHNSISSILKAYNAQYCTKGIPSLGNIPSHSIDYCFSNAVLEHIPRNEFDKMATEFFRVLKPNGVCIHRVDLKDHLGGKLNNLRFSESTWEGMLFRKSGFYTNRIRFSEMATIFRNAGFDCHLPRVVRWEKVPTPRSMMAVQFRELCDDELLVSSFDIVLRK